MVMTERDKMIYAKSTHYHMCTEELGEDRMRNHCHPQASLDAQLIITAN